MQQIHLTNNAIRIPLAEAIALTKEGQRSAVIYEGSVFSVMPIEDIEYMNIIEDELDYRMAKEVLESGEPFVPWEDAVRELDKKHGLCS